MKNFSDQFAPFNGKIWLNAASEGAIPNVSAEEAREAVAWKQTPYEMTLKRFAEVPKRLKKAIGTLLNVMPHDLILGNSASYGVHLLANGIPFQEGDEIILMQNDFATDIIPWLYLKKRGVVVKQVKPKGRVLTPAEVSANITSSTKVVCLPHVHTFSGHIVDIEAVGKICKAKKIIFIANLSQSAGTMPIDLSKIDVDAVVCAGFKWLLGPYGTGFCWMTPELRQTLEYNQAYWPNVMTNEQLQSEDEVELDEVKSAKKYDVFGTANFFNFKPMAASVEFLLNIGMNNVSSYIQELVGLIVDGLMSSDFELISCSDPDKRSALVVFTHKDRTRNTEIFSALAAQGVYLGMWKGDLRAAPHIFNTAEEITAFLSKLKTL